MNRWRFRQGGLKVRSKFRLQSIRGDLTLNPGAKVAYINMLQNARLSPPERGTPCFEEHDSHATAWLSHTAYAKDGVALPV